MPFSEGPYASDADAELAMTNERMGASIYALLMQQGGSATLSMETVVYALTQADYTIDSVPNFENNTVKMTIIHNTPGGGQPN